jgi:hypothetical protein
MTSVKVLTIEALLSGIHLRVSHRVTSGLLNQPKRTRTNPSIFKLPSRPPVNQGPGLLVTSIVQERIPILSSHLSDQVQVSYYLASKINEFRIVSPSGLLNQPDRTRTLPSTFKAAVQTTR